jgi:hypothetical protein
MTRRAALMLAMSAAALAAAAEPSEPPDAPSEELLEYLGTWNGDEEWLHSDDLLPPKQAVSPDPVNSQNEERAQPRDPAEQGK